MTASLLPGHPVSIAAEPSAQNVRNALQVLSTAQELTAAQMRPAVVLTVDEFEAITKRLTVALLQLEGKL